MLKLGKIRIEPIVEHNVPVYRPTDMFDEATPEALEPYREWLEPLALCPISGNLIMPVIAYLVRTDHHMILIDTCCGKDKNYAEPAEWHEPANELWMTRLLSVGVKPEDIDFVFCTHLHSDHCGWNTRLVDGRWEPTFPNAKYVISREEYLDTEREGSSIFTDNVLPVAQAGQVQLVDLDYRLDDQVWLEPTVGHSAGHVAVHLRSKNRHAVMCGDLIHSPLQLAEPRWNCNSDWNIPKAIETRLTFLDEHCETDHLILTSHFPLPSMGSIVTGKFGFDFNYVDYCGCL